MIHFDGITLFPEMFAAITASGITRRALEDGLWHWQAWNPRDFADNARCLRCWHCRQEHISHDVAKRASYTIWICLGLSFLLT